MLVDEEEMKKIIRKLEQPPVPSNMQLLQAALSQEYENAPVWIDETLKKQIKNLLKEETVPIPNGLRAELRSYQQRGFNWLYKNAKLGLGSLLADDMGLGKTLQVITTILKLKEDGALNEAPILVVVPTSLLTNWLNEIQKFAPSLRAHVYHGTSRSLPKSDTDVILTTYGVVRSDKEKFLKKNFYAIIIDEAQNIKNPEVAQTKAVKSIPSKIRIALSGTPVENRLSEYWSILDFANPNYLGSVNWFNTEYARPIEINQDRKKLDKFKLITSPFIMRRAKTDKNVISDLPEKIENNQYCNLTKEQAALYQNITRDLMLQIENTDGMSRRGLVLKLLLTLKQICNHPAQYLKNNSYSPELSGKSLLLLQLLETIYENNEKVLIFSQYREMGDILCTMLNEHFGKKPLQLHGGCSRKERDEMVQAFQHSKQYDTFVLSIKAGGTGLNLTAAANVIHYDLWWNPAVEAQATDRAFRIGQKQNVMVHRLLTKGTLEEKIDDMLKSKKQLANLTVANGEKWIGELSDKELKELVTLGNYSI
jgi:SNF2 family DNA or RNA helicase